MPLQVAYAKTIHTFQGLSAGKVECGEGNVRTPYECIVCDPDKKQFEGKNLGLFYTALSRARSLGDPDGLNSAIYFTGTDFNEERFRDLIRRKDSEDMFQVAMKRKRWVQRLEANTVDDEFSEGEMNIVLQWADKYRSNEKELLGVIDKYTQSIDGNQAATFDSI